MNSDQLDLYIKVQPAPRTLGPLDLVGPQGPRTLLFGYTPERYTFHVYLDGAGNICRLIYDHSTVIIDFARAVALPVEVLDPRKRSYWQVTDFEFACRMKELGAQLIFTSRGTDAELLDDVLVPMAPGSKVAILVLGQLMVVDSKSLLQ